MSLSPKHERESSPLPDRPYRDSALLYGGLAVVVLIFAALTGTDVGKAALVAVGFFVLATGWTWWRFRERLKGRAARSPGGGDVG